MRPRIDTRDAMGTHSSPRMHLFPSLGRCSRWTDTIQGRSSSTPSRKIARGATSMPETCARGRHACRRRASWPTVRMAGERRWPDHLNVRSMRSLERVNSILKPRTRPAAEGRPRGRGAPLVRVRASVATPGLGARPERAASAEPAELASEEWASAVAEQEAAQGAAPVERPALAAAEQEEPQTALRATSVPIADRATVSTVSVAPRRRAETVRPARMRLGPALQCSTQLTLTAVREPVTRRAPARATDLQTRTSSLRALCLDSV